MTIDAVKKEVVLLQNKVDTVIKDFELHQREETLRWDQLISSQENTARIVRDLTIATTAQADSTRGLVEAWQAGTVLGKLAKWLSGFAVFVILGTWLAEKLGP